jgi:hypothetical protein
MLILLNLNHAGNEKAKACYLLKTLPPIILNAGVPLTKVSLAKMALQLGQVQGCNV